MTMITKTIAKKQNKAERADRHGDIIVTSDRYAQVDKFFSNLSIGKTLQSVTMQSTLIVGYSL